MHPRLVICSFIASKQLSQSLVELLSGDRYIFNQVARENELLELVQEKKEEIDCLLVLQTSNVQKILNKLFEQGILLPVVIIEPKPEESTKFLAEAKKKEAKKQGKQEGKPTNFSPRNFYHSGEVCLEESKIEQIKVAIDQALRQFLYLEPGSSVAKEAPEDKNGTSKQLEENPNFLLLQQRRLAEKLKERLGYLGVYYKRNSRHFYRHLSEPEKQKFIEEVKREYRKILISYFAEEEQINQAIDQFVNLAFFADLSVSRILEIHMDIMDEFAQQLKLEGRSEEILLDYRLTLIDIIAHLGEMYRRSIPREDIAVDRLFQID